MCEFEPWASQQHGNSLDENNALTHTAVPSREFTQVKRLRMVDTDFKTQEHVRWTSCNYHNDWNTVTTMFKPTQNKDLEATKQDEDVNKPFSANH